MTAHLTAALRCEVCAEEWTMAETPTTDKVVSIANALLSVRCPKCWGIRARVLRMRFCQVAQKETANG